ncbi:ligand-binding sensor domain-containing protein [Sphingomonas sp. Leaf17]|uniref:ligand-binding sensor domain-containing protein n=1 Tax=Sphingomonas sp. Leaf17 TaxID=1735683 RepID=UPI00138F23FF|nr:ligand-binding sensor domain-containing diguanylate cyclase [Sphingomonas sp. Leaf17]
MSTSEPRMPAVEDRDAARAIARDPWPPTADLFFKVVARDDAIPDSGLPRAIAQDAAGFIWLATDAGLARWDGTAFKTYSTEATADAGALPEPMVNLVHADRAGRLWLGMSAEGLLWHDPATERFRRPPNRTSLDHGHVRAISDDGRGGLWVGGDGGLAHVRRSDGRVTIIHPTAANGLPPGAVGAVFVDRAGTLWVATGALLLRRAVGEERFSRVGLALEPDDRIAAMQTDRQGRLWATTSKSGFHIVEPGGRVRTLPITVDGQTTALGMMTAMPDGTLWTASRSGIWVVDTTTLAVRRRAHDRQIPGSLPEDGLNYLMRDRAGMVWAAGDASLSHVDPAPRRVLGIVDALRTDRTQPPDAAWSVAAAPDGTVWYGSADAPASRLIPAENGGMAQVQRVPGTGRDVHDFAFPVGRDAFLAGEGGLVQVRLDGRGARRLSPLSWWRLLTQGDTLYVGGMGVATVDLRRPTAPVLARWSHALSDPRVKSLATTRDGSLWVGTARGLNRVDLATGTVTRITRQTGGPPALRGNFVSTLLEDGQGRLWAGTVGGGITIFARHERTWRAVAHLGRRDGMPHDTIDKILTGSDGNIWVSTDGGIAWIDPGPLTITPLRAADGVAFTANWTGAGDRLPDGRIVFAGFGGLTIIDPAAPPRRADHAPLRFTAIEGGGRTIIPASVGGGITIAGRNRSLTASFARLDFTASRDQAYAYRLSPLESDWTPADALHRVARYTNMPPGRSTLEVRALQPVPGGGLAMIGAPLVLPITVEPRGFETTLVRAAAVMTAGALLFGLFHLRLRSARRREKVLERLVEHRTAELIVSQGELEKLAYSDTLTGLGNRRLYGEVVGRHLANAHRQPFALLLIDLDQFKPVNDDLGHDVGDALLVGVSDRLTTTLRQQDSIFRLGGDEFAVLVANVEGTQTIEDICTRLYTAFALPVAAGRHDLHVAMSIGAVIAARAGQTPEAIYKQADLALYDAKRSGRGIWRLATTDI